MDFTQRRKRFLSTSVQFLEKKLFSQKISNQGLTGMTNYGILLSRRGQLNLTKAAKPSAKGSDSSIPYSLFLLAGCGILVCSAPPARQRRLWYSGLCENRKQKRDTQLDHLCAPIFVCMVNFNQLQSCAHGWNFISFHQSAFTGVSVMSRKQPNTSPTSVILPFTTISSPMDISITTCFCSSFFIQH